jgi:NTE family protein
MLSNVPDLNRIATALPWFRTLPPEAQAELVANMEQFTLAGGKPLFVEGDMPDAMYMVLSGSLGAYHGSGDDMRLLGQVVAGETVGETALITGQPRSATVRALRDCELAKITRATFEHLAESDPGTLMRLTRVALKRATAGMQRQRTSAGPRTMAILPQHAGAGARDFAEVLAKALSAHGEAVVVDQATGAGQGPSWFSEIESRARFVLYVADEARSPWRELCLRQADAVVYVVVAGNEAAPWSEAFDPMREPQTRPTHLALRHLGKPRFGAARRWLKALPRARLHQMRDDADAARVARLIIGKAMTLVLSGGGARGFAHLGVFKALKESGVVIDAVGGTSIGAIIGAGIAADWPEDELHAVFRRSFVATNPLSDYTFPFVSMVAGRKVSRLLREAFGARDIEDLPLPYYCVSSNLTSGQLAVHRSGPVWQWLRASLAIPGVLPPVFHQGQVYVDGGVMDNLPVTFMKEWQRGEVIASDIGGDHAVESPIDEFDLPPLWRMIVQWYSGIRRPSVISVLLRAGMVNSGVATLAARSASTLLINPPLNEIDLLDWQQFDRAIEIGYQHTLRLLGTSSESLNALVPEVA